MDMDGIHREHEVDRSYRGYMTNRLLSVGLPRVRGEKFEESLREMGLSYMESVGGELEYLGMDISELGSQVLDIGIGGGRSLEQGVELGLDMYGIELGLQAREGGLHPGAASMAREREARRYLERVKRKYPNRVWEVDATQRIPQRDNSFDSVIACLSLPNYARNERELVTSILEMIRLSRERVAFTAGYKDEIPEVEDLGRYGIGRAQFEFPMARFLEDLRVNFGIEYEWRVVENPSEYANGDIVSAHLFTNAKNQAALHEYRDYIFAEYAPER